MASRVINTILNLSGNFERNMRRSVSVMNSFKKVAKTLTGVIAGIKIASIAKESVMLASDLQEVQNVVDVTFGKMNEKINDWSKTAIKSFGLSELQAKQFTGTLGALMKSSGVSADKLADMSIKLTGLAGDFASFYNLEPEEAFEKIKSGISGETEPLKALGINMSVANLEAFALTQGIKKQYKEMSQAEQVLLRYNYLMSVSKDAQGDFARTNKGFANQLRILKTELKQLGANIASYALPYLTKMLNKVTAFLDVLPKGIDLIKDFINRLKGSANSGDVFTIIMESASNVLFKVFPRKVADFLSSIIGCIVGFGVNVYDNAVRISKEFKQPFINAFNAIKNFISARIDEIQPLLDGFMKNSTPFVESSFNTIKNVLFGVLGLIKNVFNFFNNNWGKLEPIILGVAGALATYNVAMKAAALWTNIVRIAQTAWAAVAGTCNIVMGLLNGTLALTPLGWLVVTIGTVIAAGVALYKNWDTIKVKAFEVWGAINSAFGGVAEFFASVWGSVKSSFNSAKNFIISGLNSIISKINSLASFKLPSWIPGVGGKTIGLNIPKVGKNAVGTNYWKGGLTSINEHGGEIINLPSGSQVIPADKSKEILNKDNDIKVNVVIQGNVIGNEKYADYIAEVIARKIRNIAPNLA
ncbi:MAG: hypothetical protein E7216_04805 [Clostridium thermopalmarium]|uniref:hypothetical protein n=1 Tax=Clostridium thermopalmarium TaxID=29373 RepID=UPI00235696E9|nr:hypothetical protein [Clostridium thermopalmarium]MBE6043539.1 hypothetical protein [Clostridium thermopalmarium]